MNNYFPFRKSFKNFKEITTQTRRNLSSYCLTFKLKKKWMQNTGWRKYKEL